MGLRGDISGPGQALGTSILDAALEFFNLHSFAVVRALVMMIVKYTSFSALGDYGVGGTAMNGTDWRCVDALRTAL